jgi:hypothetical protein
VAKCTFGDFLANMMGSLFFLQYGGKPVIFAIWQESYFFCDLQYLGSSVLSQLHFLPVTFSANCILGHKTSAKQWPLSMRALSLGTCSASFANHVPLKNFIISLPLDKMVLLHFLPQVFALVV